MRLLITGILALVIFILMASLRQEKQAGEKKTPVYLIEVEENLIPMELRTYFFSIESEENLPNIPFLIK